MPQYNCHVFFWVLQVPRPGKSALLPKCKFVALVVVAAVVALVAVVPVVLVVPVVPDFAVVPVVPAVVLVALVAHVTLLLHSCCFGTIVPSVHLIHVLVHP